MAADGRQGVAAKMLYTKIPLFFLQWSQDVTLWICSCAEC